jgi:membrane protease YdiL (CAAX protease family)
MKKLRERILFYAAIVFNWSLVFGISWFANPRSWPEYLDRMIAVLPTVLVLIGVIIGLRFVLIRLRFPSAENIKIGQINPESSQYDKSLGKKTTLTLSVITFILSPIVEELIFRLPLLLFFSELNFSAWTSIWISAVLFMALHLPEHNHRYRGSQLVDDPGNYQLSLKELNNQAKASAQAPVWTWILRIVSTLLAGLLTGYLAVTSQSLWLPLVAHVTVNIAATILLPILIVIIATAWMFTKDRIENR